MKRFSVLNFRPRLNLAIVLIVISLFSSARESRGQLTADRSMQQGGSPFNATFTNQMSSSIDAFWVDFQGVNQKIGSILPNQTVQIVTSPGHLTTFTSGNRVVAKYRATDPANATFGIVGPSGVPISPVSTSVQLPSAGNRLNPGSNKPSGGFNLGNFLRNLSTVVNNPGQNSPNKTIADVIAKKEWPGMPMPDNSNRPVPAPGDATLPTINTTNANFRADPRMNKPLNLSSPDFAAIEAAISHVTNEERAKNGKTQLKLSSNLRKASHMHSDDMRDQGTIFHVNTRDASKRTFKMRAAMFGVTGKSLAENVARGFGRKYVANTPIYGGQTLPSHTPISIAEALVADWMSSRGHRANILRDGLTEIGCGIAFEKGAAGLQIPKVFSTQMFQF